MSSRPPIPATRTEPLSVLKAVRDLAVHPEADLQPMLPKDHPDCIGIDEMTRRHGAILTPLFVDGKDQVLDGRHRLRSARDHGIAQVPCLVFEDDLDCATLILESLCARKHYSQDAKAYLAIPHLEKAVCENVARRIEQHRSNLGMTLSVPENLKSDFQGKNGSGPARELIAERFGISRHRLELALHFTRLLKDSDRLLEKWLHANPHERELWEQWSGGTPAAGWASFRSSRLTDMGEDPQDPKTAAIFPENHREIYEGRLFSGEMGLGQINKALGSVLATKGKVRPDLAADDADSGLHITLQRKITTFNKTMWKHWSEIPVAGRAEVIRDLQSGLKDWPHDVQLAAFARLKEELKK